MKMMSLLLQPKVIIGLLSLIGMGGYLFKSNSDARGLENQVIGLQSTLATTTAERNARVIELESSNAVLQSQLTRQAELLAREREVTAQHQETIDTIQSTSTEIRDEISTIPESEVDINECAPHSSAVYNWLLTNSNNNSTTDP